MNAIYHLGTTARGLVAGALASDGALALAAWNGTTTWHLAEGGIFSSLVMVVCAVIDPGAKPTPAPVAVAAPKA